MNSGRGFLGIFLRWFGREVQIGSQGAANRFGEADALELADRLQFVPDHVIHRDQDTMEEFLRLCLLGGLHKIRIYFAQMTFNGNGI